MVQLKPLIKEIENACREGLAAVGFQRRRGMFIREINDETLGWLGLNRSTYRAEQVVDLYPIVGVINKAVERFVTQWTDRDNVRHLTPAAKEPVCYLTPQKSYRCWRFTPGCDIRKTVHDMVENISRYGLPWMRKLADRKALLELLLSGSGQVPEITRYTIPGAYLVLGEREKAREYVAMVLKELSDDRTPFVQEWAKKYAAVMLKI